MKSDVTPCARFSARQRSSGRTDAPSSLACQITLPYSVGSLGEDADHGVNLGDASLVVCGERAMYRADQGVILRSDAAPMVQDEEAEHR